MFTAMVLSPLLGHTEARAAFPDVVVTPPSPPSGPIPIPYPNTNIPAPEKSSALFGFTRAEVVSGGVIVVIDEVIIE